MSSHAATRTPRSAWKALKEGNERFVAGQPAHPSQSVEHRARLAAGQQPNAVVFGCADSRVAAEIIFDQGLGDMFVVRTAGHVIDSAVLGSIEYAVTVLGVPLIVVLGHDSCGAVKATLTALDDGVVPGGYVRDLVERVTPSILQRPPRGADPGRRVRGAPRQRDRRPVARRARRPSLERIAAGDSGDRRRDLPPGRRTGGAARIVWATSANS